MLPPHAGLAEAAGQISRHLRGHHRACLPTLEQHLTHHRCGHYACGALCGQPGPSGEASLCLEEVAPPASGTRKARVLYDYEAADSSELALLADELITVYSLPGMDPDWLIGERGNKKGKVPVTYLELLS